MLLCSTSTVVRVRRRFGEEGELGLIDRRGDNGPAKVNEDYILALIKAVERTPLDYGYRRPTWTQELLIRVLTELTGITVSRSALFIELLKKLDRLYADKKVTHLDHRLFLPFLMAQKNPYDTNFTY